MGMSVLVNSVALLLEQRDLQVKRSMTGVPSRIPSKGIIRPRLEDK